MIFGVESDLLNENGDICTDIYGVEGDFILLSRHEELFIGDSAKVANGFIKAIKRYHDKIDCIGHVCNGLKEEDAKTIILAANEYNVPLELNAKYFIKNPAKWVVLLENAKSIYVNSDAHILTDLRDYRKAAFKLLKEMGY